MRSLTFTFDVLSVTGMWLPSNWEKHKNLKRLYYIYTVLAICMVYLVTSLELLVLVCSEFDIVLFVDVMFTLLTAISICFKTMNFVLRKREVSQLRDMLEEEYCLPKNYEEAIIQHDSDTFIKKFTIVFNALGQATLVCQLLTPLFQDPATRSLPIPVWVPYDLREGWNYWKTFLIEIVPMFAGVLLNVTTDVIVSGFVLQACTQIDLLTYRLHKLPQMVRSALSKGQSVELVEQTLLEQTALHHENIIRYAKKVTKTFDVIIVEQYFASVLLFSVIVYRFTMGDIPTIQKVMAVGYIICMTGELFAYCWFGNEITLKSLELGDDIYKMDWTMLSTKANKTLMFIMMRTSRPIVMSYGDLVVLNIESFKSIIKVTYSAFNLLKESGGKDK